MPESQVGQMEENARKRREKILAMKKRKTENQNGNSDTNAKDKSIIPKPELKLRSYQTETESLKRKQIDQTKPADIEANIQEQLESQKSVPTIENEIDIFKLAPKKIDFDLKRDLKNRLEKLERRTNRAVSEIVREKLKETTRKNNGSITVPEPAATEDVYSD